MGNVVVSWEGWAEWTEEEWSSWACGKRDRCGSMGRECCGSGKGGKVRGAALETGNNLCSSDEKLRKIVCRSGYLPILHPELLTFLLNIIHRIWPI